MNRDATLAVFAVLIVLVSAGVAVAAPDALADRTDEHIRPAVLDLQETKVSAGERTGETAVLSFDTRFRHAGGPAENVSLEVQAVDAETGMVVATRRTNVGDITAERELSVRTNLTVPREGGYRIVTRLYENGSRVATGHKRISGVGSLTPDYARSTIQFHRFQSENADLPVIAFSIENVANNRTTLRTQTYLTNGGSRQAGGLKLVLMARQADSNIIADRTTVQIGQIGPGKTVTPEATLTVPDNYNYHLDAILMNDGVIIETASAPAVLDPELPKPDNQTQSQDGLDTGEFESNDGTPTEIQARGDAGAPDRGTSGSAGPGFGVPVAVVALLGIAALIRRRQA